MLSSVLSLSAIDFNSRDCTLFFLLRLVLTSDRAIDVNIEIMRAFVKIRQLLLSNKDLARKLELLEKKYDHQFKAVFDAIKQLMKSPDSKQRKIGFVSR